MTAMMRLVTDDDIGLRVLREAPVDAAEIIDIIAVHGIGAHPDETWCRNIGTTGYPRWVNWLDAEDMLPAVVPQARIMRYGYQSQWFGKEAMRHKVSTVAERLLLALRRKRVDYPFRPLLIISHCFGGLVVLKALVEACHHTTEWHGIFKSTFGLLFFGTPFRGAQKMSQIHLLAAAQQQYQKDEIQLDALKVLEPGNEFLQEVVDQFGKTRSEVDKAKIACFYELKISDVGKMVGGKDVMTFAVTEDSGCLGLSEGVRKYSLSRTHFDMNKFGKPTEEDFETVCEVIQSMVQASRCSIGSVLSKQSLSASNTPILLGFPSLVISSSKDPQALKCNPKPSTHTQPSQKPKGKKKNVSASKLADEWSSAEDQILLSVVQRMDPLNWKVVAQWVEKRSPWACQKRFERLNAPK